MLHEILAYLCESSIVHTKKFEQFEDQYRRINEILGTTYSGSVFLESLRHRRSLEDIIKAARSMPMEQRRITFLRPIRAAVRHRNVRFSSQRYSVPPDHPEGDNIRSWIEELEDVSKRIVANKASQEDVELYSDLRNKLSHVSIHTLPHSIRLFPIAKELRLELRKHTNNPTSKLSYEFQQSIPEWPARDSVDEAENPEEDESDTHESADWTGRRTISQQVHAIRRYLPLVLEALEEIIDLYERVGSNRERTKEELKALGLLRLLHSELGTLLAIVDAGKPFAATLKKAQRAAQRVFGLAVETRELLIAGTPAMAAAGLTSLAALKGLDLCGIHIGTAEAGASLGLTGTVFAAHSVAKTVKSARHD